MSLTDWFKKQEHQRYNVMSQAELDYIYGVESVSK